MQTLRTSTLLRLTELETRDNPSGTVNALMLNGILALTGDDNDNQITSITVVGGATPSVTITPDANTTIDNLAAPGGGTVGSPVTIPGVLKSLRVRLAGGNDLFLINSIADFALTGSITIDLGDGDNVLGMQTSGKFAASSLTVTAGDGLDNLSIGGGIFFSNPITGDVSINMGVGRGDQNDPDANVSNLTITRLEVQGANGLRVNALEGDEDIELIGNQVKNTFRGDGGVGSFKVHTTYGNFGSIVLDSVGIQPSNPQYGTLLRLFDTTVNRHIVMTSESGVDLRFINSTSGTIDMSTGTDGCLNANFQGNNTVNGNFRAKAYCPSVLIDQNAKLTINGNMAINGVSVSDLTVYESELAVRNLEVTSEDDYASVMLSDDAAGTPDKLTVNGTMTIRGESAAYIQEGGTASILNQMTITATSDKAEFITNIGNDYYDAPGAITTIVNGSLSVLGPNASASLTESELTTATGILIQGQKTASYSTQPSVQVENPNVAGEFSKATGGKTTVQNGGLTVKGTNLAKIDQTEGIASYAKGVSVISTKGMAGVNLSEGAGINSVGPKLNIISGSLLTQGRTASWIQSGGEATIAKGIKISATNGAQFITYQGETHDREFNYSDLPATTNITGGGLHVLAGSGVNTFRAVGGTLNVSGDVILSGKRQNFIEFSGATGTTVGGSLNVLGATGEMDSFIADTSLTVNKHTSINLGTGTNAITLGGTTGTVLFKGNLSLVTGNGSDQILLKSVNVQGNTTITTGNGADLISIIGNSTFTGTTAINTGLGDDRLEIANDNAATGPVTFTGLATFKTSDGNDTLILGKAVSAGGNGNTRVQFTSVRSTIMGERNLNRFDDELSQFDPANLTITGFVNPV